MDPMPPLPAMHDAVKGHFGIGSALSAEILSGQRKPDVHS